LGARIAEHFVEVVFAPEIDEEAIDALRRRTALRILCSRERRADTPGERDYRRVVGGLLVQERDGESEPREAMELVAGGIDDALWEELIFAWRVCKQVSSNAIV